jgi:hypothetical protein
MFGPTDLLYPSPAQHFNTFQVFVMYFPMCPSFSTTQSHAPKVDKLDVLFEWLNERELGRSIT